MIRLLTVLSLLLLPLHAQSQQLDTVRVDLERAVQRALEASPEVEVEAAQRAFAEARHDQAQASRFLTEFTVTTGHAVAPALDIPEGVPKDGTLYLNPEVRNDWEDVSPYNQIEAEALQPIWTWGELSGSIEAARHGIQVEAAEVESKALEVARRTSELYFNLLLAEALERVASEASDVVDRAEREVQRLIDEGDEGVDQADLYQVQITAQEVKQRVVEVEQQLQTARAALRRSMFLPDDVVLELDETQLEPIPFELATLEYYQELGLKARPELAQAAAGVKARRALVKVARSDYFPKFFANVRASARYAPGRERQRNPYISDTYLGQSVRAGVGFRQKLNFFQTKAKVEQASAELREVEFQREGAYQLVLFEVEQAYRDFVIAKAALDARDESLTISKKWLRTEQLNFDLDLGDTENLIDAVRANLGLQAQYYEAVRDYNVSVVELLRRAGTLTSVVESGTLVETDTE